MTTTSKVAYNALIQAIGKIIYTIFSLIIITYLTRYLGTAGYGEYNIVITFWAFFAALADLGLMTIMVREVSKNQPQQNKIFANTLGLRIFSGIIAAILAISASYLLHYNQAIRLGIIIFSLGIFFTLINQLIIGLFQIHLKMTMAAVSEVLGRGLTVILTIIFIKMDLSLAYIILSAVIGNFLNLGLNLILAKPYLKFKIQFNFRAWKKILKLATPVAIIVGLSVIFFRMDTIFLSVLPLKKVIFGPAIGLSNTEAAGIYGAAYRILEIMITFSGVFVGLVYPIFSRHFQESPHKGQLSFQKSLNFSVIFSLLVMVFLVIMSSQIISLIGGVEFEKSSLVLKILGIAAGLGFLVQIINYFLIATGHQKALIKPYIGFVIFSLTGYLILIPYFSYLGAAVVTLSYQMIMVVIGFWLIWRHLKFLPSFLIVGKGMVAGAVSGLGLWWVIQKNWLLNFQNFRNFQIFEQALILIIIGLVFSGLYLLILYLIQGYNKQELKAIFTRK